MKNLVWFLNKNLKKYITNITQKQNIYYIFIKHPLFLENVLFICKNSLFLQMNQLLDLWVVDLKQTKNRFQINYLLNSTIFNKRFILRIVTDEFIPVPTVTTIFPSANWLERESYDMFGVLFANHPDLRRILTDYGFEGYPLRKDFPLTGYTEVRFDDELNRVVYEPVVLTQEYRYFDFISPWEQKIV